MLFEVAAHCSPSSKVSAEIPGPFHGWDILNWLQFEHFLIFEQNLGFFLVCSIPAAVKTFVFNTSQTLKIAKQNIKWIKNKVKPIIDYIYRVGQ